MIRIKPTMNDRCRRWHHRRKDKSWDCKRSRSRSRSRDWKHC